MGRRERGGIDPAIRNAVLTSQLAEIGTFPATNMITNGNFASTSGVSTTNVTATAASNKLRLVATGTGEHYGEKVQSSAFAVGHVYYARVRVSGIVGKAKLEMFNRMADGNYESAETILTGNGVVSIVLPVTSKYATPYAALRMRVMDAAGALSFTAGSEEASWEYLMMLDLTAIFGAGNEPTAAQMNALLARWPNSWFDGTVNLAQCDYFTLYLIDEIRKLRAAVTTLGGTL